MASRRGFQVQLPRFFATLLAVVLGLVGTALPAFGASPMVVSTATLPSAAVGSAYAATLSAAGGTAP